MFFSIIDYGPFFGRAFCLIAADVSFLFAFFLFPFHFNLHFPLVIIIPSKGGPPPALKLSACLIRVSIVSSNSISIGFSCNFHLQKYNKVSVLPNISNIFLVVGSVNEKQLACEWQKGL